MKGIVVEIKGNKAIILSPEGGFIKVQNKPEYALGMEVNSTSNNSYKHLKRLVSTVAAVFVLFFVSISLIYNTPKTYINIDINPSIELVGNIFGRIIKFEGINEDGTKLIEQINIENMKINNMKIEDGVENIIEAAEKTGLYFDAFQKITAIISISGADADEASRTVEKLETDIVSREKNDRAIEVIAFNKEAYDEAKESGLSPGKLKLINNIVNNSEKFNKEEISSLPVKDLMEILNGKSDVEEKAAKDKDRDKEKEKEKDKGMDKEKDKDNDNDGYKDNDNKNNATEKNNDNRGSTPNNSNSSGKIKNMLDDDSDSDSNNENDDEDSSSQKNDLSKAPSKTNEYKEKGNDDKDKNIVDNKSENGLKKNTKDNENVNSDIEKGLPKAEKTNEDKETMQKYYQRVEKENNKRKK